MQKFNLVSSLTKKSSKKTTNKQNLPDFVMFEVAKDRTNIKILSYWENKLVWEFNINWNQNTKKQIKTKVYTEKTHKVIEISYTNKSWLLQQALFVAIKKSKNKQEYYELIKKWDIIWKDFSLSSVKWEVNNMKDLLMIPYKKWWNITNIKTFINLQWKVLSSNFFNDYYRDAQLINTKNLNFNEVKVKYRIAIAWKTTYLDKDYQQIFPFYFESLLSDDNFVGFNNDFVTIVKTTEKTGVDNTVLILNWKINKKIKLWGWVITTESAFPNKYWLVNEQLWYFREEYTIITKNKVYETEDYMEIFWPTYNYITWFKLENWKYLLADLKEYSWEVVSLKFDGRNGLYWYKIWNSLLVPNAINISDDKLILTKFDNLKICQFETFVIAIQEKTNKLIYVVWNWDKLEVKTSNVLQKEMLWNTKINIKKCLNIPNSVKWVFIIERLWIYEVYKIIKTEEWIQIDKVAMYNTEPAVFEEKDHSLIIVWQNWKTLEFHSYISNWYSVFYEKKQLEWMKIVDNELWTFKKDWISYKIRRVLEYERTSEKIKKLLNSWAIEIEKNYIYLEKI